MTKHKNFVVKNSRKVLYIDHLPLIYLYIYILYFITPQDNETVFLPIRLHGCIQNTLSKPCKFVYQCSCLIPCLFIYVIICTMI